MCIKTIEEHMLDYYKEKCERYRDVLKYYEEDLGVKDYHPKWVKSMELLKWCFDRLWPIGVLIKYHGPQDYECTVCGAKADNKYDMPHTDECEFWQTWKMLRKDLDG